jgi:hypothetical protein
MKSFTAEQRQKALRALSGLGEKTVKILSESFKHIKQENICSSGVSGFTFDIIRNGIVEARYSNYASTANRAKSACVKWADRNGLSGCEIVENLEV